MRTAMVTLLILFSLYAGFSAFRRTQPEYVWCGWEKLIADVTPAEGGRVNVYTSENLVAYHTWFATRRSSGYKVSVIKGGDTVEDRTYFVPRGFSDIERTSPDQVDEKNIVLLYRTEPPVLDDWLFRELKARGYTACPSRVLEYGPSTAFRVEMTRDSGNCIYPY